MKIRFAVAPAGLGFDPVGFATLVDGLEAGGFDTIWLSDVPLADTVDPMVGLAFAASRTRRLKLGANIVPVGRNPMLLAKDLAQLDQLSRGRVLISLVPGLDQPGEREALGIGRANRGAFIDEIIPLLRRWWSGETVEYRSERFNFPGVAVRPRPVQNPLEIWLGGVGPAALTRAGRLADGWLGAAVTPDEALRARTRIQEAAADAGRQIDPEHFGLSVPYSRSSPTPAGLAALAARRPDVDPAELLPSGRSGLRSLIGRYVDAGLSKFVVRATTPVGSWDDELTWLRDAVRDLES
jgi:probable F420-dependent oxidoreductase